MTNAPSKSATIFIEITPPRPGLSFIPILPIIEEFVHRKVDYLSFPSHPLGIPHVSNDVFFQYLQDKVSTPKNLHLTLRAYKGALELQNKVMDLHQLGVKNLLLMHGDESHLYPSIHPCIDTPEAISMIKNLNRGVDFAGALLKEKTQFRVGCVTNMAAQSLPGREKEPAFQLRRLHQKIQAGADFLITQPVFSLEEVDHFIHRYESLYGPLSIPMFFGLLPICNVRHFTFLSSIPGITIPPHIAQQVKEKKSTEELQKWSLLHTEKVGRQLLSLHHESKGWYLLAAGSDYNMVVRLLDSLKTTILA